MSPNKRKTTYEPIRIPLPPQNPTKFLTSKAEEVFNFLIIRSTVPERGFRNNSTNYRIFMHIRQHWKHFYAHPTSRITPIVRELHANMRDIVGFTVFVRGVWVPFDGATINRVLGLSNIDSDEFKQLVRNPDYNEIVKKVASPNAKWSIKKDGGLYEIPRGCLTEHAKALFYFMSSRLLPSKHVSTVYRDRAMLLYAMLMNFKLNLGNIIQTSLI